MPPTFPFLPPVLVTESADEQNTLYTALQAELRALGAIDMMSVGSLVSISLDIARYQRCKVALINMTVRALQEAMRRRPAAAPEQRSADCIPEKMLEALSYTGSTDEKDEDGKTGLEVSERLSQLQLNEFDIEAVAIRIRSKDLERLDRMIDSLELRRTRVLRMMVECREAWGRQLSESTRQVMDGKIAHALDRHPELERQLHEAMQKDEKQLRWSFPPEPETPRKGRKGPPRQ
jgi:hypothetical protein